MSSNFYDAFQIFPFSFQLVGLKKKGTYGAGR